MSEVVLREYFYPDYIKYYCHPEGDLIGVVNTRWLDQVMQDALTKEGYNVVNLKPKGENK